VTCVTGEVSIRAEVERKRFGIFSYKSKIGGEGAMTFAV